MSKNTNFAYGEEQRSIPFKMVLVRDSEQNRRMYKKILDWYYLKSSCILGFLFGLPK